MRRSHLGPVVVLAFDPKNGNGRHAVLRLDPTSELDRRDGLEQRVQWSAQQTGLLAGDDGDRSRIREFRRGGSRRGRRTAPLELADEKPRKSGVIALGARDASDGLPPG